MQFGNLKLSGGESALFKMRTLFEQYGYSQYKVSKFEEYDLYAKNKSFLVSDNVLTFTDTTGRLMALKPDVTLSIVKNTMSTDKLQKLYYSENVYRTAASSQGFKEIMQTGLECVGNIDLYSTAEVIMLAAKSLATVSEDYILDISHMGFLSGLIQGNVPEEHTSKLLEFISQKNSAAVAELCENAGVDEKVKAALLSITSLYMPLEEAISHIEAYVINDTMKAAFEELLNICKVLGVYGISSKLYLDFSVINDMRYYNGIIFTGFINGISDKVLSGGRYDNLLKRMGKSANAIGFAFYLDTLEQLRLSEKETDVDVALIYNDSIPATEVIEAVQKLVAQGKSVRTMKTHNTEIRAKEVVDLTKAGEGK